MKTTTNIPRPLRTTSTRSAILESPFERVANLAVGGRTARPSAPWCPWAVRVCLSLFLTLLWANSVGAQGTLTNGLAQDGAISTVAEADTWTIAASQGDRITVQIAELSGGAGFTPRIELFTPDGAPLGASSGAVAARLDVQADVSGNFTLVVRDLNQTGTGTYRLRLAQTPVPFTVPAGDDGGVLANGTNAQGNIEVGDLDLWTIPANQGDRIIVQVAEASGGAGFTPQIELFAPNGVRLGADSGSLAARLDVQAGVNGNYTVLVSDLSPAGFGGYYLHLAQVPGGFVVPIGDQGGVLADGVDQDGDIPLTPLGDLDLWTFEATPGDLVTLQITELSGGAGFNPMLELFDPNGQRRGSTNGASTATLERAIEVGGTYTVLVSERDKSGTGTYRLHLTRGSIAPAGANVLTNGVTQLGAISSIGTSNSWTFTASVGDRIVVRVGEITQTGNFTPRIRLRNPGAVQIASASAAVSAEIAVTATNSGTFTVVVDDSGSVTTGTYRITLAKSSGNIFVSPGDEGGTMTNGVAYQADLPPGDLDVWNFTANAGEAIVVKVGQITDVGNFDPWVRLYGPDGVLVRSSFDFSAAEVEMRATNSGTFLVVIGNNPYNSDAASGSYRLTLAKTGDPIVVSPGDDGGSMTNGVTHLGDLPLGDLDLWNFTANAGEAIVVKVGQITDVGNFDPWVRLYGPDGVLVRSSFDFSAAEVEMRATNSGTYLVVIGNNPYNSDAASGLYRLTLAKTGDPIVVSPGDDGGSMTNGVAHQGDLPLGDLDLWNFIASTGESIVVKVGQITDVGNFDPWVRLYGPDGALLGSEPAASAAEVTVRATNSGTFLVVIGNNPYYSDAASGTYRLTLAKTGDPIVVSPGDDGGSMTNGVAHQGDLPLGDLDLWNFTASTGESIVVKVGQITDVGNFDPWVRLYGPDGALLGSVQAASAAEVAIRATNSGTFLVVIGNYPYYSDAASGSYRLTLAKTGDPIVVSPGDDGGPMTNGVAHQGDLPLGDLDLWNFTANTGEAIVVRVGEITDGGSFDPWVRLYSPSGVLLGSDFGGAVGELTVRATNSGTFLVVIANNPYNSDAGNGSYFLTLAKTGVPAVVSPGDEGGQLTGAGIYSGNIPIGDVDLWTFTICVGEAIDVRVDETTQTNNFAPWVRLYGPNGLLIGNNFGATFAAVSRTATNSGTYLLVIGNNDYYNNAGSGTYQLTVNGLSDGFKLCDPVITGSNINLGAVGGVTNATFILFTHTNVVTPLSLWFPMLTNQFDQFGAFRTTNTFDRAERQRYYKLLQLGP